MALQPGTRVGRYEVAGLLGVGGMGEVYRAHDRRLARDVAVKLLPDAWASDPDRLARFEREARALAALNHPNIATIHGIEDAEGRPAIVMELVEGESLDNRLRTGRLPLAETLRIGSQIAEALDAAHERGIVHRDLKPGNIKIRPDGTVKVLDFGLAKMSGHAAPAAIPDGPTVAVAVTQDVILGTPAYMSPEQARGRDVDKRTDIWAFGCLLYEMLTSRAVFARETRTDTLVAVVEGEPDWSALPSDTPLEITTLLRRCLEKDSGRRLRDIGEARIAIEAARGRPTQSTPMRRTGWPVARWAALATMLAIAAAAGTWWWSREQIRSLAILPPKPLVEDGDNHIGLTLADSIILGLSGRAPALTISPISAVRAYATSETDAITAARSLGVDAVLDGTWQREVDRFRLNLRLLRTSDGASVWSDRIDVQAGDVFALQDQVTDRISAQLQVQLLPASSAARHVPRPEAFDLYSRGVQAMVHRGGSAADRTNSDNARVLFEQAVRIDPDFASAHAMLGFAYIWTAIFIEENESYVDLAEKASSRAEELDPSLGQVHMNRALILWSWYRGWQIVEGIREMRKAVELSPTLADAELGSLYYHLGLFSEWQDAIQRSIALDPTNLPMRRTFVNEHFLVGLADDGLAAQRRLLNEPPDWRYWLTVGDHAQAASQLEKALQDEPSNLRYVFNMARLRALQGRHEDAQRMVTTELDRIATNLSSRNRSYHHHTYSAAVVFALGGKGAEAAKWLQTTIDEGFPCYPLFATDPMLDRVRDHPDVKSVIDGMKTIWDRQLAELGIGSR